MTTIACDGRTLAGDGRSCISDRVSGSHAPKLQRLNDGSLLGMAGTLPDLPKIVAWIEGGEQGKPPKISNSDALRLMPDGSLLHYDDDLGSAPVDPPFAIGSGADFAIGAMDQGADATRAVQLAAERDPFTGGTITSLRLT